MMQKMGWTPGEGLGKHKEGQLEPLLLDVKLDKRGLQARQEVASKRAPIPLAKKLSGKHPVSALVELCIKRKWNPPEFQIVFDGGPDHKKNFLMKVIVNNQEYKPAIAASTKKLAKANAAAACLQALGLICKEQSLQQPAAQLQTTPQIQYPSDTQTPQASSSSSSSDQGGQSVPLQPPSLLVGVGGNNSSSSIPAASTTATATVAANQSDQSVTSPSFSMQYYYPNTFSSNQSQQPDPEETGPF